MVRTYDDWTKQKSREKLLEFILKYMKVKPQEAKVLCFPGAERKGEEGLEIFEVYDKAGIQRHNIVGLEYNKKNAKRLEAADLGIIVEPTDAYNYLKTTNNKFDIISLDYTGQRTWKERDITRYIAGRQLLNKFGIFCTNHFIKREGRKMQESLLDQRFWEVASHYMEPAEMEKKTKEERIQYLEETRKQYQVIVDQLHAGEIDLDIIRRGISMENIQIIASGITELYPSRHIFRNLHSTSDTTRIVSEDESPPLDKIVNPKGLDADPEFPKHKTERGISERSLVVLLMQKRGWTYDEARAIVGAQAVHYQKGSRIRAVERYTYTSNKNAKMLLDMVALSPFRYGLVQAAKRIVDLSPNTEIVNINPARYSKQKLRRELDRIVPAIMEDLFFHIPEPVDLGSSWVPKERLSKKNAIELLKAGFTSKEICECYSGFRPRQLDAYKAHYITMGKELKA